MIAYAKNNFGGIFIMKEKVILAYSGGLDTTAIIPWLKENFDYEVICVCVDCGQAEELDGLEERAKFCGASKLYIENVIDEFCDDYIVPCVQAHAVYENKYLLGTSMARPLIAKKLVEIARKEGASAICHGATGKGNDQIRFELGIKALAPDLKIIAAWRNEKWTMDSRESEIAYCQAHGINLPFSADSSYSRDRNIWHISHEGLELEDPANEPNYEHLLVLGTTPEKAPNEGEYVTMTFEKGVPTSVNGEKMKVSDIIRKLNELGGKHGASATRGADPRPRHLRDEEGNRRQVREPCLRRKMVHSSARGRAGVHRGDSEIRDRRGEIQALQGQYHQGRDDLSVHALQREHRFLHDRRPVRSSRRGRLHQPLWPELQGSRDEAAGAGRRPDGSVMLYAVLFYLIIVNIVAFALMGIDKKRAKDHAWRIPERTLFLSAILGGSIGAIAGMQIFRHKTKHWYFQFGMPAILLVQIAIAAWILKG